MGILNRIDIEILMFINNNLHSHTLDKIMTFFTSIGNGGTVWIIISVILIITKKYRYIGIMTLSAIILSTVAGEVVLKNIIRRPRPFLEVPTIHLLISKPHSYSFPSGHTTISFAAAGVISRKIKGLRVPVIILACIISFSRMYLFVHYPSDILGGFVLGLICSAIIIKIYNKIETSNSVQKNV